MSNVGIIAAARVIPLVSGKPFIAVSIDVMRQGRWRSPAMVARYTRAVEAGAAGKWL